MKIENFELFPFSMSIPDIFHLKSCIYRSTKHTGHLFLVDPFQHSNLRSLLKIFKKNCKKLWKLKNFGIFVNFGVKLRLFHSKTETISSLKTTRQQNATLVNVFNIPIYGVCRNRDRNWIKTLKIGKFWVFCRFWVPTWDFLHLENCINFFGKTCWTNAVPCLRFATFWSTKSVENVTKIA